MKIHQNYSSSMTPLMKKKIKRGPEAMPKFLIVMSIVATVTVLRGTHWVLCRQGTCLTLRFQMGSLMLFKKYSRNSSIMAAVCTVHTSLIRIFNCLYFLNVTLKTKSRDHFGVRPRVIDALTFQMPHHCHVYCAPVVHCPRLVNLTIGSFR